MVYTTPLPVNNTQEKRNTMKTSRIYSGALAVLCAAALVIGSAGAVAIMQKGTVKDPVSGQVPGEKIVGMLDNLTAQGYDVSAIRTAVESGNYTTAMTLIREFRTANPDAFPARANGTGNGHRAGRGGPGTTNCRIGF